MQTLAYESPLSHDEGARATLEVVDSGGVHHDVGIPGLGLTIGRAPDQNLVLEAPTISKRHARVFWRGDDLFFDDLDSCNGSRRDGIRITEPTLLEDGDEIVLGGSVVLRVTIRDADFGVPASDLIDDDGLVPAELPPVSHPPTLDLLPVVTRLYQATSFEELGLQLTRTVGDVLGASRVALLELGEGGRVRALSIYKHARFDPRPLTNASFVSATVLARAMADGVALFTEGHFELSASIIRSGAHSAVAVRVLPRDGRRFVLYADSLIGEPPLTPAHAHGLEIIGAHAVGAVDALSAGLQVAQEQRRFDRLRRYFSPDVVEHILSGHVDAVDKPKMVRATVVFADLVGYTKLSEQLEGDPQRLAWLLNQWLDAGAQAVLNHGGTLDKFIGDCVMALFGAPFTQEDAERRAVHCALDMRERIAAIARETGENLQITVGVNTGPMLAGSVGSKRRLEYTVMGDTVNVASRLQGQATSGQILVGGATAEALAGTFELADAGVRTLKNHGPVRAYEVVGPVTE